AATESGGAEEVAAVAERQGLVGEVLVGGEIGERHVAGRGARIEGIGRARPAGRRRAVAVDRDRDGRDRSGNDVTQLWPGAPVDRAARQMEQEVGEARAVVAAGETAQQLFHLRPDARKGRGRGKEGIEEARPHAVIFSRRALEYALRTVLRHAARMRSDYAAVS